MLFSSTIFIFFFLPLVLGVYFLAAKHFRNLALLLFSLLFYFWTEGSYVLIMILSGCVNYSFGVFIEKCNMQRVGSGKGKLILAISVCFNLGLLIFFKYFGFVVEQFTYLAKLMHYSLSTPKIYLPIGISFFTFKALSYLVDVYRRDVGAQKNLINYSMYQALFTQLVAGPIVRYREIVSQINERAVTLEGFKSGIERFVMGLGKKVLIANQVAAVADHAFNLPLNQLSCTTAWLGIICYTLQIYFDFSGYSDMAIGLGRMFGLDTPENFDYPYISRSIREFWRRWHITLSRWFRDYLYIPLGGNKKRLSRTYINLILVFFLCGLWHGASWTFIIWGLWHGLFLVFERTKIGKQIVSSLGFLSHIYTNLVIIIGWVFFSASGITQALNYLKAMFGLNENTFIFPFLLLINAKIISVVIIGFIGSTPVIKKLMARIGTYTTQQPVLLNIQQLMATAVLLGIFILSVASATYDIYRPFIYFRF